jgi:hypothetical protein
MGIPPASGSWDQMRRIQISAKGGGECAVQSALKKRCEAVVAAGIISVTAVIAGIALIFC